ncbi:MAG TPA: lysyl oxidase family protein [Actinomycetota bacterium]|nr:lysyl oxidase family protein [Actinomycetota bacterium]
MRRIVLGVATALGLLGLAPAVGAQATTPHLPNLVPLPPLGISVGIADDQEGSALRLTTAVANRGTQALDLVGVPQGPEEAAAFQCVVWAGPRACAQRSPVGRFVWHPAHAHFHFEDFALYELRALTRTGVPDMSDEGVVATGGKVSFCLIDVEPDRPPDNPLYSVPHPLYYSCIAGISTQGISPGWRDVYSSGLAGQQIPIDRVKNGTYAVVVTADPDNRLYESDDTDNAAAIRIKLTKDGVETLCVYDSLFRVCE